MKYIYTIRGSHSEEDAIDFMIRILLQEHSDEAADEARIKGFKRTFAQTDAEINSRLKKMHAHSQNEYSYKGIDTQTGLSVYAFWGLTQHGVTQQ